MYRSRNSALRTQTNGLISRARPDIAADNVTQNANFNDFPNINTTPATPGSGACDSTFPDLPMCPNLFGLGVTDETIGSKRQIQMSLDLTF